MISCIRTSRQVRKNSKASNMKSSLSQRDRAGFTLIEILVVITIIAVLASIGFGTYMLVNRTAAEKNCKLLIENVGMQLEKRVNQQFTAEERALLEAGVLDTDGVFPAGDGSATSTKNLVALIAGDFDNDGTVDDDQKPLISEIDPKYTGRGRLVRDGLLVDPWNRPMYYRYPGEKNNMENGFDLWSAGPDGKTSTDEERKDDVDNW